MKTRAAAVLVAGVLATAGLGSAVPTATAGASQLPAPALTPPMGWNSWNQMHCNPTEQAVKAAADALVSSGLRDAGYDYVVLDDCWQAPVRGLDGSLQADSNRFPDGIKALADYVHARGLKFGIYAVPGSRTCGMTWNQYPAIGIGSLGHEQQDANTFASWGVDYLKYDWCGADTYDGLQPVPAYTKMRDALVATGREITYSISEYGKYQPWTWAHGIANLWRTTNDLQPSWSALANVIQEQAPLADYTGSPGGWNDPDMLQVGNGTLSEVENRTHVSMWAILNAPLFAGTNVSTLSAANLATLSNPEVIAIDQDFAGNQGRKLVDNGTQVWGKALSDGGYAVALYNPTSSTQVIRTDLATLGLSGGGWKVRDVWARADVGTTNGPISATVPAHGTALLRLSPHGATR